MFAIGYAAQHSGVHIETIRYYERRGILPAPARSPSGRRRYSDADITRLRFIRRCRDLGFGLKPITQMLGLINGDVAECGAIRTIAHDNLDAVQSRIQALTAMSQTLSMMIDECNDGREGCPIAQRLLEGE